MKIDQIHHKDPILVMHTTKEKPIGTMKRPHVHDSYELYYLVEGERDYFIENQTYQVESGMVVLIKPGLLHRTIQRGGPDHERLLLNIHEGYFKGFLTGFYEEDWFSAYNNPSPILSLSIPSRQRLYELLMKAHDLFKAGEANRLTVIALEVLYLLKDERQKEKDLEEAQPAKEVGGVYDLIKEVATYINGHYGENLSLQGLADQFFISPYYLSRQFAKVTGFHFKEYLNQVRTLEAQKLLSQSQLSISRISDLVGYDSVSHFGRVFKSIKGISPTNYRKGFD